MQLIYLFNELSSSLQYKNNKNDVSRVILASFKCFRNLKAVKIKFIKSNYIKVNINIYYKKSQPYNNDNDSYWVFLRLFLLFESLIIIIIN